MNLISKKEKQEKDALIAEQTKALKVAMEAISAQKEEITKKDAQLEDKAVVTVANFVDIDKELELSPEVVRVPKVKDGKVVKKNGIVETEVKLSMGPTFSGVSLEDVLSRGYGTTIKFLNYYKAIGVLRKCTNMTANFTTRAGFETTVKCLDDDDDPERPAYLEVKHKVDELNRKVNMDHVLFVTQIKRFIHGNCGWEIVPDGNSGDIVRIDPLDSAYIIPRLDKNGEFTHIDYSWATNGKIPKERLLYFNVDCLENNETSLLGISLYRAIERNIKIKKNLERDLLYASRSLWAPIVIYQAETRGLTSTEKKTLFDTLKQDLRPGAVVITNSPITHTVVQYNPDLNNLIRAIEMQDIEIIGSFGIPRTLLSREKSMARATLEFSIRAFYESTIAGEQAYLKRQLERQWYDPLVESLGFADKIRICHEWRPILSPASDLITALVRAGEAGLIDAEKFFQELGWHLDKIPEQIGGEEEHVPPREEGRTPPEREGNENE